MRAALREVGHGGPYAIEDLFFLRALEAPDTGGVEFRVRLKSSDDGFNFEVQSGAGWNINATPGWCLTELMVSSGTVS